MYSHEYGQTDTAKRAMDCLNLITVILTYLRIVTCPHLRLYMKSDRGSMNLIYVCLSECKQKFIKAVRIPGMLNKHIKLDCSRNST